MRVDFLGTGAGNFRGTRRQPCSTLFDSMLLDCGAGTTGRLHDAGRFNDVEAVLISHLHSDHIAGIFDLLLHTFITGRTRPLTVISPPGLGAILRSVYAVKGTVVEPTEIYPFHLIEGHRIDTHVGSWHVRSFPLDHTVVNLGYLLRNDGISLFFSGDTREPSIPRDLRADYLIHEATFPDEFASLAREYGHSTAAQAAGAAVALGARQLWINHVGDRPDSDREISADARRVFPDSLVVEDRARFDV
jgi:ribonuclease Z